MLNRVSEPMLYSAAKHTVPEIAALSENYRELGTLAITNAIGKHVWLSMPEISITRISFHSTY